MKPARHAKIGPARRIAMRVKQTESRLRGGRREPATSTRMPRLDQLPSMTALH